MSLWLAHLFLFLTSLIGALNFSVSKLIMPSYLNAGAFIVARGISSAIFFFIIDTLISKEKFSFRIDGIRLALCALTGIVINQLCFYEGLARTSPTHASLIIAVIPVTVFIVALISGKEKISWIRAGGLALGFIGVTLLINHVGSGNGNSASVPGDLLVLINSISYGIFMVIVTPLMQKYPAITIVKWLFSIGLIATVPYGWKDFTNTAWSAFTPSAWLAFGFVIVFATWLNYYLNTTVLRVVNPSVAGIYIYLQPVLAIIIAVLAGQDQLDFYKLICAGLIFTGVYLVSRK